MEIKERLNLETQGHKMYDVRREEFKKDTGDNFNFRVSPKPFKLTKAQKEEMLNIGKAVCDYMDACIELYKKDEYVRTVLNRGKPDSLIDVEEPKYMFLRPDLILTEDGFSICEIETSPFGLALAEVLNRTYGNEGFDPLVNQNDLSNYIQSCIAETGTIAYSDKVKSFGGQLDFLAEQVFSGTNTNWNSRNITGKEVEKAKEIYRAFYLSEAVKNPEVASFLLESHNFIPSRTPQFEEKALMAFIWDKRYTDYFRKALGQSSFDVLRKAIPKTWILGEEDYVDGGLPGGASTSIQVASLGKKQRRIVLKKSGFDDGSSWGESVVFLHKKGAGYATECVQKGLEDSNHLYVMQEFRTGKDVDMQYFDENNNGQLVTMTSRIRLTPYFSYIGKSKGKLIAVKVTGCDRSAELIHAGTSSINTSVIEDKNSEGR